MNALKRHIVFLARWYPYCADPMFGLFVQRHAQAVAPYQNVSVVYAHALPELERKIKLEQTIRNGVHEIHAYYRKPKSESFWSKIIAMHRFLKANKQGIREAKKMYGNVDLIHVHVLTRLGVLALYYKTISGIPYMITEHWSRYLLGNDFNGFFRKRLTKLVVKKAEMVTTVSKNLADAMQNHGLKNKHYAILPNVVDMDMFHISETKNEKPRIVHVSCFEDKSKNISGMLRVLTELKKQQFDFECILVGDGIDFQKMKLYATELELDSTVRFTGVLEGKQVADEIIKADFMILFSNYETQGVVLLENFACGRPVIATCVGGIPEIVDEENGLLVPPGDEQMLLEAIKKMMQRYKTYDPLRIRQKVEQQYGNEHVGSLMNQWYLKILEKHRL